MTIYRHGAEQIEKIKKSWTPERKAALAERNKANPWNKGGKGRVKGSKNVNPYPFTDAVVKRIKENPNMSYKGKFSPSNPEKYDGDPTNIIYRSFLELRFMQYLDSNASVLKWQSEEFCIPYFDPATNRARRYFPDFLVVVKNGQGTLTQLVEIKPEYQTKPPKVPSRKTKRFIHETLTYGTNISKWKAAEEFCKDRNWKFKIITEKDLGIKY